MQSKRRKNNGEVTYFKREKKKKCEANASTDNN